MIRFESRIEIGDCREIMRQWIAAGVRVQMCVTSPPYWGLRDYGVAGCEINPEYARLQDERLHDTVGMPL